MGSSAIRGKYLDFFAARDHTVRASTPLIPKGDASLMFNSAGMVPFKPYFLGIKTDLSRAASSQKCFRTTDIDRVGHTLRHLTFFEMLGNFSFGDYFKKESIAWAWEFMTKEMGFDPKLLHPTVFREDDEALELWRGQNVPNPVTKLGEADNFWNMGPTGPCGPCSEIYFDRGPKHSCGQKTCGVGCECDRYIEVWNLVFTQFDRQADGSLNLLPRTNIDTGMGLERLAFTASGKDSLFDTDLFAPIVEKAADIFAVDPRRNPETELAFRVIADHGRAATMLASEGVLPSNVERGYVLRRLVRRAARYGRLLGHSRAFIHQLVPCVVEIFADAYPELKNAAEQVSETLKTEEEKFLETLEHGEAELKLLLEETEGALPGAKAFKLYDTFGFPLELTKEICSKRGIKVDEAGFEAASKKAVVVARASWKGSGEKESAVSSGLTEGLKENPNEFTGHDSLKEFTVILASQRDGDSLDYSLVLEQTPFYPESGGQVGDKGGIYTPDGARLLAQVIDVQKQGPHYVHHVRLTDPGDAGSLGAMKEVLAKVDEDRRMLTVPHHTATHLLNAALRKFLGDHVRQAGSYVGPDKLRFDFTHPKPLGPELVKKIEDWVNAEIQKATPVETQIYPITCASDFQATTLLGEEYGEKPRFVYIGAGPDGWKNPDLRVSLELCGGTHAKNTSELIKFRIIKEASAAAGIRRIEALAGRVVDEYEIQKQQEEEKTIARLRAANRNLREEIATLGGADVEELPPSQRGIPELRAREKELTGLLSRLKIKKGSQSGAAGRIMAEVGGLRLCAQKVDGADPKSLRGLADNIKNELGAVVVFIAAPQNDKLSFVLSASKDVVGKGFDAAKVAKAFAAASGGSAGGRADFAQGGVKDADWETLVENLKGLF